MGHENGGWMNSDQRSAAKSAAKTGVPLAAFEPVRLLAVDKPLNEMNSRELLEHFGALTDGELRSTALSTEAAVDWEKLPWASLALEATSRLSYPTTRKP